MIIPISILHSCAYHSDIISILRFKPWGTPVLICRYKLLYYLIVWLVSWKKLRSVLLKNILTIIFIQYRVLHCTQFERVLVIIMPLFWNCCECFKIMENIEMNGNIGAKWDVFEHVYCVKSVRIGVILVRILLHLGWIRRDNPCLSLFSPNAGKYRPEKLRIRTLHAVVLANKACRILVEIGFPLDKGDWVREQRSVSHKNQVYDNIWFF